MDIARESLEFHRRARGKITVRTTLPIASREDLALTYTPGVAAGARAISDDPTRVWELTGRGNRVVIVTDGSAVLGLGNIGPEAALPVMEGKAALMKEFADIDAFPICLNATDTERIVQTVMAIAPSFGGINLEDISAPRCFEIEETLKRSLTIPVFHDDQHGTAIVVLAGLMNALKVRNAAFRFLPGRRPPGHGRQAGLLPAGGIRHAELKVVISGAGAAGTAIARMLLSEGVRRILVVDSRGIISRRRDDLNSAHKTFLAAATNPDNIGGSLAGAMEGADVFIGVSAPGIVTEEMVRSMNRDPIVFAMANPDPEIMPGEAKSAGAAVVATGRSDFPNQVNNLLAFPGIFRGALDAKAGFITEAMHRAAAEALAASVGIPTADQILPDPLDRRIAESVAAAVAAAAQTPPRVL